MQRGSNNLFTNFFQLHYIPSAQLHSYKVEWEPAFDQTILNSEDNKFVQQQLNKLINAKDENKNPISFNKDHQYSLQNNYRIFSPKEIKDKEYKIGTISFEEKEYNVTVRYDKIYDIESEDAKQILGRLVKRLMARVRLVKLGRKYFDTTQTTEFQQAQLQLMQGYDSAIQLKNQKVLLQIDSCVKLIRTESYLNILKNIQQESDDYMELMGGIVQANYGDRQFYRVGEIDYAQTPTSTFESHTGKTLSYMEYYSDRYQIKIQNPNQPLIKCIRKKRGVEIVLYLIPELCRPTGETKQHRQDFRLQQELGKIKHAHPSQKIKQNQNFLEHLKKNSIETFDWWGLKADEKPLEVPYDRIQPGKLQLGKVVLDIEKDDLDRGTQAEMLKMPFGNGIDRVLVLYSQNSQNLCDQFLNYFQQSVEYMKFKINNQPRCIGINDRNDGFNAWKNVIDQNIGAQLIICILPGPKKKGRYYKELKIYLTNVIGVFSQMICEPTVKAERGLRVVCNKLIQKITSKTGGVPYSISDIPDRFSKQPTMMCGIDIFHQKSHGKQSVLGFVASVDQNFAKYFTATELMDSETDITTKLAGIIRKAVEAFGKANKCAPKNIVIYRDGVSQGQIKVIRDTEIQALISGIKSWGARTKDTRLSFIIVNKRITTKFFTANDGNFNNAASALPGTLVYDTEINENCTDFYIVSQKAKQGVAIPTHYHVIHNELPEDQKDNAQVKDSVRDLQIITYKLCFLYYNCTHSIKIPAPAKLAHRLSNYVGEKYEPKKGPTTFINAKDEMTKFSSQWFL